MSEQKKYPFPNQEEAVAEENTTHLEKEETPPAFDQIEEYENDEIYNSPEAFEHDKEKVAEFLQYPKNKRKLAEYFEKTYKSRELEEINRSINREEYEHESELEGSTPYHKPGHIGSLMYQYLNMVGVENAFASGLQHTKSSLTKTVQQRVDEINTLLRGVGGFNRQIKSSFSRSAVLYLEQEDPRHTHRERVIFTVNLADFELRHPLSEEAANQKVEDGRSVRRLVWDEAVNSLSEIVSNTGLKPKYVRNNKNDCSFSMRQYLMTDASKLPDEYFEFTLKYMGEAKKAAFKKEYWEKIEWFDAKIAETKAELDKFFVGAKKKKEIWEQIKILESDKEFYLSTTPDPDEMDTGISFSIYVNTMKDYTITKDKMQVIMTKFILALSSIALDKSMDQQVNTNYQNAGKKSSGLNQLDEQEEEGMRRVKKLEKKVG